MKFIVRCAQCGDQNPIDDDERSSIQLYFNKGTSPNIMDRMVLYCTNCGNQEERGISWPLDIIKDTHCNCGTEVYGQSSAGCPKHGAKGFGRGMK